MKKIMFNDRYGLTEAVINGRKRETRRLLRDAPLLPTDSIEVVRLIGDETQVIANGGESLISCRSRYRLGEPVAVAQSYKDADICPECIVLYEKDGTPVTAIQSPGWNNKMFTRADLMPHQIQITGVRIERLHDITDKSCLREGIEFHHISQSYYVDYHKKTGYRSWLGRTPREAFAALIDKVSGRGTWDRNPYVVVYEFELVK